MTPVAAHEPALENVPVPQVRCDGQVEACRSIVPHWPNEHLGLLCATRSVFCRYVEGRPAVVGGYRTGDLVLGHEVPDRFVWAVWQHMPPELHRAGLRVLACESTYDETAVGADGDSGPWQFIPSTWRNEVAYFNARGHSFDPDLDARFDLDESTRLVALIVERDGGWRQWSCRKVL